MGKFVSFIGHTERLELHSIFMFHTLNSLVSSWPPPFAKEVQSNEETDQTRLLALFLTDPI